MKTGFIIKNEWGTKRVSKLRYYWLIMPLNNELAQRYDLFMGWVVKEISDMSFNNVVK